MASILSAGALAVVWWLKIISAAVTDAAGRVRRSRTAKKLTLK